MLVKEKRNYIKNQIEENQRRPKNSGQIWRTLVCLQSPIKHSTNIGLHSDNSEEIIFEDSFVANKFSQVFCNIAAKLVDKLPKTYFGEGKITEYYKDQGVNANSFNFTVVTEDEVLKLLQTLNTAKSTGCDNISPRFLREGASVSPLTYVINLSLKTSQVHDFKTARVVPLLQERWSYPER